MEENLVHSSLDFLKVLERFTLESKLLACQKYSSRIMTCSQVDMVKAYEENIMPWEIEAFAAYSIVYDTNDATEELDGKTFADTITLIRNYWHSGLITAEENGEYPEAFMMISALQQFPVQGVFLQKLYRYHYFFTFQNDRLDMRKVFFDKMGVNYEQLEEFAFLVFLGFSKEAQDTIPPIELQKVLTKAFKDKDVLHLLSIEKEEYRKQLFSLYDDNIIDQYYGLKIQYLYPFISGQDFTYIPSPYLVVNAVTESMLNRITLRDNKLRREIGKEVIESYLYDIVGQLDTISWISPEIAYKKGKANLLTSDVIAAEGDAVIFYDTKAITPSLKLRKFDAAEIYGIVVVLEDAVVSRKKVYEKVCNILQDAVNVSEEEKNYICSHIKILPLRAIECMILQNTSILPELKEQLDKPEKWYYYTYTNTTTENGIISSYAQYEHDLKGRISKQG